MKKRRLGTLILSGLFAMSALTGCTKDEIDALKGNIKHEVAELQAQIDEINEKIEELRNDMDEQIEAVKDEFQAKINEANSEITTLKADLLVLTNKHNQDKAAIEDDYNTKISNLESTFTTSVSTLQASINSNTTSINQLTEKHNSDITTLTNDYNAKINALELADQQARDALEAEFNEKLEVLQQSFNNQLATLQTSVSANSNAITNLTNKHNSDVTELTNDYTSKIEALGEDEQAARDALETEFNTALEELNTEFASALASLQQVDTNLQNAITELTETHNSDIADLVQDYQEKISQQEETDAAARLALKTELNNSISALNTQFSDEIAALQAQLNVDVANLNTFISQYNNDKIAIQQDYNNKIESLEAGFDAQVESINADIAELNIQISNLTTEMNAQITNIQNDYTSQINSLTGRVSALENVPYHTVTFEVQGDLPLDIPAQIVKHGEKATRPYLVEDPGYYYYSSWYSYDGHYYEPWYFMSSPVTEDMTLTTLITANSYTIKLNNNYPGSTEYTMSGTVSTGQTFTCPVPYYADHAFEGWYYGDQQVTDKYGNSLAAFNFAADITLYAHWREIETTFRLLGPDELYDSVSYNLIANDGENAYAMDEMDGYYVKTSRNLTEASNVTVTKLSGRFIIKVGDHYLGYTYVDGHHDITLESEITSDSVVWFDYDPETFKLTFSGENSTTLYLCLYNNYMRYSDVTTSTNAPFSLWGYGEVLEVESASIIPEELIIFEGYTYELDYSVYPINATVKTVSFSSDSEAATVDQYGYVTGVSEGTATITLVINDAIYATCEVSVYPSAGNPTAEILASEISISSSASPGSSASYTEEGITIDFSACWSGSYSGTTHVRCGASSTVSFSGRTIVQIDFVCTGDSSSKNYGPANFNVSSGSISVGGDSSQRTGTWTGSSSELVFTCSSQVRIVSMLITYVV